MIFDLLDLLSTLLLVALIGVLIIGLLSPVESLRWWAGGGDTEPAVQQPAHTGPAPDPVVVYLSGIGSISGDELLQEEADFLDRLAPLLPAGSVVIRDVFPYSVRGVGLTGARTFAGFWRLLDRMRLNGDQILTSLINLRNVFQVAVAADPRYGPIFSAGVAQVIAREAVAAGFRRGSKQRLVLLGYSGGAQVAVGVAPFLRESIDADVRVISLGGVLDSDPGLRAISRLDHLVGDKDVMEKIGRIVYPGRWPISTASAWNRARREGLIRVKQLPGMAHNTPGGYMDPNAHTSTGELNPELTAEVIAATMRRDEAEGGTATTG
jgi:hypothetical protein